MMLKPAMALMALAAPAALTLGGCLRHFHHHPYATLTALTCPQSAGDLARKSAAADGKSCAYVGPGGDTVTLQLLALNGGNVDAALQPIETSLRAEQPAAGKPVAGAPGHGRVDIDLPGIHIHASGKDDSGSNSNVRIGSSAASNTAGGGGVDVEAQDNGAQIRIDDNRRGVRRDLLLASDSPGPNGYKVAGYSARGPQSGPLVVATILAKDGDHDRLEEDIHALMAANLGR